MKNNYKIAQQLLYLVTLSYTTQYLGTIWKNDPLKYISVLSQLYLTILTITTLRNNKKLIDWNGVTPLLLIVLGFPLIRILGEIVSHFDVRTLIDGLLINGTYYILGFTGLAIASLSHNLNVFKLLYHFSFFAIPLGVILAYYAINMAADGQTTNSGLLSMVSCFIPIACLALVPFKKKYNIIGWIAILCIFFVAARVYSRSYTLIGVYFTIFSLKSYLTKRNRVFLILLIVFIFGIYQTGFFSFFSQTSLGRDESVSDKFQFTSLFKSIGSFFQDGDYKHLFYWEGNSRQEILIDAFGKFSFIEWIWGRGIFGKYVSFAKRHTIEIGFAQELFRWGILYVLLMFYFLLNSFLRLKKKILKTRNVAVHLFSSIVLIKLLDMFVYGLPESSPYSFLMFWAVMCLFIKEKNDNNTLIKTQEH